MTTSKSLTPPSAYLDFTQFNKLKKEYRENSDAGIQTTARQLEGVFLNMMLKSMRQANAAFSEGNYLNGKESEQYRDMYDQQLTANLSARGGIGLADMIARQMKRIDGKSDSEHKTQPSYEIAHYRERAIPALLRTDISDAKIEEIEAQIQAQTAEAQLFAPTPAEIKRQEPASKWQSPDEFVEAILPHAQRAAKQLNVDPMAIVAQAVLETGWGKHVMSDGEGNTSFNLFGIKATRDWEGDVVRKKTLEYRNGIAAPEYAAFRSYSSLQSAFDDYVNFLKSNPRYQKVFSLNVEPKQWGYALQQAGYATDPNYGNKIARLMESDSLQTKATSTTTL